MSDQSGENPEGQPDSSAQESAEERVTPTDGVDYSKLDGFDDAIDAAKNILASDGTLGDGPVPITGAASEDGDGSPELSKDPGDPPVEREPKNEETPGSGTVGTDLPSQSTELHSAPSTPPVDDDNEPGRGR